MCVDSNFVWNKKSYSELIKYLESLKEEEYKKFNMKLTTTKYEMLGIRTPIIRNLAKKISKSQFFPLFDLFNNEYFEVVFLEGLMLTYIKDYDEMTRRLKEYVKKIDNWAICDMVVSSFKVFNKEKEKGLELVNYLINSSEVFSKRFGYVMLLDFYVSEENIQMIFDYVKKETSNEYYVNMAVAWLLCECYVKFTSETYRFLCEHKLNEFVLRKTISKVNDSFRVSKEQKQKLKKIKSNVNYK